MLLLTAGNRNKRFLTKSLKSDTVIANYQNYANEYCACKQGGTPTLHLSANIGN